MRILLVSANTAAAPYPVFPLGAAIVAQALRDAGHAVTFVDWLAEGCSPGRLRQQVADARPELMAVAIRNIDNTNSVHEERYLDRAAEVVAVLRASSPAPVVLGGAGFSLMPEAILRRLDADYGIAGEGELALVEFAALDPAARPPRGTVVRSAALLPPGRIGRAAYGEPCAGYYVERGGMVGVQTKRGCEYACAYCTYPFLEGHDLRPRRASDVVDDIERLMDNDMTYLFFVDAVFNDRQGLYRDVVAEMRARKLSVRWTAYFSPRAIPEADLAAMVETGLAAAEVGSDAATDATLRGMNKPHTWAEIAAFDAAMQRHGVPTAHYFMFGGPGETPETLEAGIHNVRSLEKTVRFIFSGIRVLPGTAIGAEFRNPDGTRPTADALVEPHYYFSPAIPRAALEARLRTGFADDPLCLYPAETGLGEATELHRKGFCGPLWEMLLGRRSPRRIRRHA